MVGRCADYALESFPNHVSIFVYGDLETRIHRIARRHEWSDSKAKDAINKTDKQRASYYNYYTSKKWGDIGSYDLCINSSVLGIDGTVDLIRKFVEEKEERKIPRHISDK